MTIDISTLIGVSAAARLLGDTEAIIYQRIRSGDLPAQQVAHRWLLDPRDVTALAEWRSTKDVAQQLDLTVSRIHQIIKSGAVNVRRIGRGWFIHRNDVERLVKERAR